MKVIACVALVLVSAARATAGDKIVLESFTGGKTDEATRVLSPLLDALSDRAFVNGYEMVGRKFESRVSRPAVTDRGLPGDFRARLESGHRAWILGMFDAAVDILTKVVDDAHANPGAFADHQDGREQFAKGMIALALSQQRRGDHAAMRDTFAELLRSFPAIELSRAIYGPDAVNAFEQARKELGAAGRGKLVVRSNLASAVVFINEKNEGGGTIAKDNLLPGVYRVFVRLETNQLSRSHAVVVRTNETAIVTIDPEFDIAVQTSPTWTGLAFATAADRERSEIAYAAKFGRELDAAAVAVVGIDQVRGHPAIVGLLVNRISGSEIRRASVPLDPAPSVDRMRALAEFLAGENLKPEGIEVSFAAEPAHEQEIRQPGAPTRSRSWAGWKYVLGGSAIAAAGASVALLAIDGACRDDQRAGMQCLRLYQTATPGYVVLGSGAVLAAITVYLFVRSGRVTTAYVTPTSGGAMAGLGMRF